MNFACISPDCSLPGKQLSSTGPSVWKARSACNNRPQTFTVNTSEVRLVIFYLLLNAKIKTWSDFKLTSQSFTWKNISSIKKSGICFPVLCSILNIVFPRCSVRTSVTWSALYLIQNTDLLIFGEYFISTFFLFHRIWRKIQEMHAKPGLCAEVRFSSLWMSKF